MKQADNFDLRKFITEGRLLKENINEDDLKLYYNIIDDIFNNVQNANKNIDI